MGWGSTGTPSRKQSSPSPPHCPEHVSRFSNAALLAVARMDEGQQYDWGSREISRTRWFESGSITTASWVRPARLGGEVSNSADRDATMVYSPAKAMARPRDLRGPGAASFSRTHLEMMIG